MYNFNTYLTNELKFYHWHSVHKVNCFIQHSFCQFLQATICNYFIQITCYLIMRKFTTFLTNEMKHYLWFRL